VAGESVPRPGQGGGDEGRALDSVDGTSSWRPAMEKSGVDAHPTGFMSSGVRMTPELAGGTGEGVDAESRVGVAITAEMPLEELVVSERHAYGVAMMALDGSDVRASSQWYPGRGEGEGRGPGTAADGAVGSWVGAVCRPPAPSTTLEGSLSEAYCRCDGDGRDRDEHVLSLQDEDWYVAEGVAALWAAGAAVGVLGAVPL
jgi:hypothetical protein